MSFVKPYATRPVIKEAVMFDGTWECHQAISDWMGIDLQAQFGVESHYTNLTNGLEYPQAIIIPTIHIPGVVVNIGEYIIKQCEGDFYPVKPEVMAEKYTENIEISGSQLVYQEFAGDGPAQDTEARKLQTKKHEN